MLAADQLLFRRGVTATPVDEVLALAGVSPATLYRAFGSKDGLLVAALERRLDAWLATWDAAVAAAADDEARLLAVFDALETFRARPDGARWCAFLGSAAEHADPPAPLAAALARDTDELRTRLRALAVPVVGETGADGLAESLLLVVSGDLAMRLRDGHVTTSAARDVARAVVASARQKARP